MFVSTLDWLLQIGFDADGRRRVFALVEVQEGLTSGTYARPLAISRNHTGKGGEPTAKWVGSASLLTGAM
jgi:hypothetical protein